MSLWITELPGVHSPSLREDAEGLHGCDGGPFATEAWIIVWRGNRHKQAWLVFQGFMLGDSLINWGESKILPTLFSTVVQQAILFLDILADRVWTLSNQSMWNGKGIFPLLTQVLKIIISSFFFFLLFSQHLLNRIDLIGTGKVFFFLSSSFHIMSVDAI